MITLTRLNDTSIVVNVDLIKFIEATPDTLLTLSTGDKLPVRESVEEVVNRVIEFKRQLQAQPPVRALEI
ncbi:MAG: flagellar FlbD family protein [Candidatus Sericytochromatia bacterium]|nr:flagellar FlbD family protein [Roseimicrobium sp.]